MKKNLLNIFLVYQVFLFNSVARAYEVEIHEKFSKNMEDSIKGATGFELVFNYIAILYKYGVGLISLFCVAIIVFSGVQMITGGINSEAVNDAKERIFQAIFSLVLLLGSAFILNFVNPGFFK